MNTLFETTRLYVRELLPQDAPCMYVMDSDSDVHRYVGKKPVHTIEETQASIGVIRQQYVDKGIGRWAVIEKSSNEFIGWVGFKVITERVNGHINHYDFGYRLTKSKWGQGFGMEAAKAALDYGVQILNFKDVFAMTDVANKASRRILEKLGFKFITIFNYDGTLTWREKDEPATWYELTPGSVSDVL